MARREAIVEVRRVTALTVLVWGGLAASVWAQQPPPDGTWTADAIVAESRSVSDPTLGAAQGVAIRDGKIYAYGDVHTVKPRVGVMREFGMDLVPTGRVLWLRRDGAPLIIHPTGLTWDKRWGTFLGDTIKSPEDPRRTKAKIYRLDWERAWSDGNLDHAVLDTIDDDAAINGCRPTFVNVAGRTLLATADYGSIHPEIRLYDPETLLATRRSSSPGVVVATILSGPYNQNLYWDSERKRLTCVQNVIEGRGWRLDILDLAKGVADGRADGPGVRVQTYTFSPHNELEGYWPVDGEKAILVTSSPRDNLVVGTIRTTPPAISPATSAASETP